MHKTLYVKVYTYLIEQLEEARQKNNKKLIEHYLYEIQRLHSRYKREENKKSSRTRKDNTKTN
jgi:flagellin-specific chaperone FliS